MAQCSGWYDNRLRVLQRPLLASRSRGYSGAMRAAAVAAPPRPWITARSHSWPLAPLALLGLAVAALLLAAPPLGDFPINDDWDYARMLQGLVEHGRLQLEVSTTPTFILQAYWGALFVQLFGFSHNTLRASTLVLAGAGVIGLFFLLRELTDDRRAVLGALLLLFNP